MPRSFGRYTTSIWNDPDFTRLSLEEQGAYFMLGLQAEVTAAGTLPATYRRWSKNSRGATPVQVEKLIGVLVEAGHVLTDDDTEELLIVKFIKWDQGYNNAKRLPVIIDAARAIRSPILRAAVVRELTKLGLADKASEISVDMPSDSPSDTPSDTAENAPSDSPSDSPSDGQSPPDRVVVTEVGKTPQSPILFPASPDTPSAKPAPPSARQVESWFNEFWLAYPRKDGKDAARRRFQTIIKRGADPGEIIDGAKRYATERQGEPREFTKMPEGWLNAGRWEDEPVGRSKGVTGKTAVAAQRNIPEGWI